MKNLIANYHTHTKRCGHASGEDREYVENAIKSGIKTLGFSDHSPMIFDNGWHSGFRVPLDLADDYFNSIQSLKKEYKNDIDIKIGVETEYYPETFERHLEYLSQYPIEYMILGQHFIYREEDQRYSGSPFSDKKKLTDYVDNVISAVHTGKFLYVAHPDLIYYQGDVSFYKDEMRRLAVCLKNNNIPVEINRLGLFEHRQYPNDTFFEICREVGNKAIIGVDAHSPSVFLDEASIDACAEYANKFGLELVRELDV